MKDEVFDKFVTTGSFEETNLIKKQYIPNNYHDLYMALFWLILIALPSIIYCIIFFVNGTWLSRIAIIAFIIAG